MANHQAFANGKPIGEPQQTKIAAHRLLMVAWFEKKISGAGGWQIRSTVSASNCIVRVHSVGLLRTRAKF